MEKVIKQNNINGEEKTEEKTTNSSEDHFSFINKRTL